MTTWFNGDIYTTKLTPARPAARWVWFVPSSLPVVGRRRTCKRTVMRPSTLVHGSLEFLDGERTFTARTGDTIYLPRGTTHRFFNSGLFPATLLFLFAPGGPEGLFVEGGDEPQPGVQVQPLGPERLDEQLLGLLTKYDIGLPPAPAGTDTAAESHRHRPGTLSVK